MAIVSSPGSWAVNRAAALLGLIVGFLGATEQCIRCAQTVAVASTGTQPDCQKNFSTVFLLEEPAEQVNGTEWTAEGSWPMHQATKVTGRPRASQYGDFEFWLTSTGLPSGFLAVLQHHIVLFDGADGVPEMDARPPTLLDTTLALWAAKISSRRLPALLLQQWVRTLLEAFTGLFACFRQALVCVIGLVTLFTARVSGLLLVLMFVSPAQAVTCHTCYDQCLGCAGGAACPLLTTVASNAVAIVAT